MVLLKRFTIDTSSEHRKLRDCQTNCFYIIVDDEENVEILCERLNELQEQVDNLKRQNKKRKRKNKNDRAVIEELGSAIIGYKGELNKLHTQIREIREAMDDTGALTKRQLEEILNG